MRREPALTAHPGSSSLMAGTPVDANHGVADNLLQRVAVAVDDLAGPSRVLAGGIGAAHGTPADARPTWAACFQRRMAANPRGFLELVLATLGEDQPRAGDEVSNGQADEH
jgi:hypothetical protein